MAFTRLQTVKVSDSFAGFAADTDGTALQFAYGGYPYLTRIGEDGTVSTILQEGTNYFEIGNATLLSDGRYLITSGAGYPFGYTRGVNFQILNRDGSAAGDVHTLYPSTVDVFYQSQGYSVTATQDGGFSIAFTDITYRDDQFTVTFPQTADFPHTSEQRGAGQDVYTQHFDNNAIATGGWGLTTTRVETVENGTASRRVYDQAIFDTATLAGGQVAYVYFDQRHEGSNSVYGGAEVFTQLSLTIEGGGEGARGLRVDDNPLHQGGPNGDLQNNNEINGASGGNIVALANGTLAVVWEENSYVRDDSVYGHFRFDGTDTYVRYFAADGAALTDATVIVHRGTELGNIQRYTWAEALPDGRIVIAYNDGIYGVNGNGESEAYVATVGNLGQSVEIQRISPDAANSQAYGVQDLVVRDDGSVDVIIYKSGNFPAGSDPNGTYLQHFTSGFGFNGDTIVGDDAANTLNGTALRDEIAGYRGDDILSGGNGADLIFGNEGVDRLFGEQGADKLFGNEGDDILEGGSGGDDLRGGDGLDSASYALSTSAVAIDLGAGTKRGGDTGGDVYTSIEGLIGTAFNDVLTGDAGNNRLEGLAGNDTLTGRAGDDSYVVETSRDRIVEAANEGTDTVYAAYSYTLGATLENLVLTGSAVNGQGNAAANAITGTDASNILKGLNGNDTLTGLGGRDALYGGTGTNTVSGGEGNDRIYTSAGGFDYAYGGAGDDTYIWTGGSAYIYEAVGGGNDTVRSAVNFQTLGDAEIESIILVGTAGYAYGTNTDNRITGNALGNYLLGYGGDDVILGGGGDDVMIGGEGNDTLVGGRGTDQLRGEGGRDVFLFYSGDTSPGRGSMDRIFDFSHAEGDRISLAQIDAVEGTQANDRFTFIGDAAFHHVAGEVRFEQDGSNTFLIGDTDGDGRADLTIQVNGLVTLIASDLIL